MKINGISVTEKFFAYDGCHKIYLLESDKQADLASGSGYSVLPIHRLQEVYSGSCELKFISDWNLKRIYCQQFDEAMFALD